MEMKSNLSLGIVLKSSLSNDHSCGTAYFASQGFADFLNWNLTEEPFTCYNEIVSLML